MKTYSGKQNIQNQLPEILYDESRFTSGIPDKVFFPQTLEDILTVVRDCSGSRTPLTVIGGKTGITGGCVPIDGCVALCFSDMNKILSVGVTRDGSPMLLCEPGITLEKIAGFLEDPRAWPYPVSGTELLDGRQWFYPPDPTEMTAQLGGTVATNASGARSFRFGSTRSYVESLLLVLANGETLSLKRGDCSEQGGFFAIAADHDSTLSIPAATYRRGPQKNASGYFASDNMDLIDLFTGSEGTLAIFSCVGIRLLPKPEFVAGLSFFPSRDAAFGFASFLRDQKRVFAIEYFDESALRFLESAKKELPFDLPKIPWDKKNAVYWEYGEEEGDPFEDQLDKWEEALAGRGSSFQDTWSGFDQREKAVLKTIRHGVPEAVNSAIARYKRDCPDIRKISTDTALPAVAFERVFGEYIAAIAASGLDHAVFGHLGDFHLHINLVPHTESQLAEALKLYEEMMRITVLAGGTISAEHGIGKLKTKYLAMMYGNKAMAEMAAIKSALDPHWQLNRGTLFSYPPAS
jgi:D-lactate dehydrogenase (cytochrome)